MITPATLKSYTVKDLSDLARKSGLAGWQTMRKEQLVKALVRALKTKKPAEKAKPVATKSMASKPAKAQSVKSLPVKSLPVKSLPVKSLPVKSLPVKSLPVKSLPVAATQRPVAAATNGHAKATNGHAKANGNGNGKPTPPPAPAPKVIPARPSRVARQIQRINGVREKQRDLTTFAPDVAGAKDRLVLMVRDSYWLHVCWEVTRQSVERARAAMAEHWHTAQPTIRVLEVETGATTSTSERIVRDITIHGGVKNWYIDVKDPPKSYRVDLGYLSSNGKFFVLGRSNVVTTPLPGSSDAIDENWSDVTENYEKIYAQSGGSSEEGSAGELQELFEERLRRPMGAPLVTRYGVGAERMLGRLREFQFEVEAEMIVFGTTHPNAHVQLGGEPVKVREDGSFTVRLSMPDRRQVIPIVAASSDGIEQRTIVLAVERNTKVMEPMIRESNE